MPDTLTDIQVPNVTYDVAPLPYSYPLGTTGPALNAIGGAWVADVNRQIGLDRAQQEARLEAAQWRERQSREMMEALTQTLQRPEIVSSRRVDQQFKLIENANQFLAARKLAGDLESGMPVQEAMRQNWAAISPSSYPAMTRALTPVAPRGLPVGTVKPVPGGNVLGLGEANVPRYVPEPVVKPPSISPLVSAQSAIVRAADAALDREMMATDKETAAYTNRVEKITKQRDAAMKALSLMGAPADIAPGALPPGARVRVQSPDGKIGTIPVSQVEEARRAGYAILK